jgi:hypothetical protein
VRIVGTFSGDYEEDEFGLAEWWSDEEEAIAGLIERIQDAYDAGFRRFVLNRPGGCCEADEAVISNNVWGAMPEWKQTGLTTTFKDWWQALVATDPTVQLGIYAGWMIRDDHDDTEQCMGTDYHQPDLNDSDDVTYLRAIWENWIDIGLRFYIADNAAISEKWVKFGLFREDWKSGDFWDGIEVKVGCEAIPRSHFLPDVARSEEGPALGLWRFIRSNEHDSAHTWTVNPDRSEISAAIQNDNEYRGEFIPDAFDDENDWITAAKSDIRSLMERGFSIWDWQSSDQIRDWIIDLATVPAVTIAVNGTTLTWHSADRQDNDGDTILAKHYEIWRSSDGNTWSYQSNTTNLEFDGAAGYWYRIIAVSELNAWSPESNEVYVGGDQIIEGGSDGVSETQTSTCPAYLRAFNIVLRAVNQSPITSLDDGDSYMAAQIEPLLDSVRVRVLDKASNYNVDCVEFTPDENGVIHCPGDSYRAIRFPVNLKDKLTIRNQKVWDRSTQTYFNEAFTAEVILDLPFCAIPPLWQEYIAREAAAEFAVASGQGEDYAMLLRMANRARATAYNSEFTSIDSMIGFEAIRGAFLQ